jgi:hypothetical protein
MKGILTYLHAETSYLNTPRVAKGHLEDHKRFSQMTATENSIRTPLSSRRATGIAALDDVNIIQSPGDVRRRSRQALPPQDPVQPPSVAAPNPAANILPLGIIIAPHSTILKPIVHH